MRLSSLCKSAGETYANGNELVKAVHKKTKYSLLCRGLLTIEVLTQHKSSNVPHSTAQRSAAQRSAAQRRWAGPLQKSRGFWHGEVCFVPHFT